MQHCSNANQTKSKMRNKPIEYNQKKNQKKKSEKKKSKNPKTNEYNQATG